MQTILIHLTKMRSEALIEIISLIFISVLTGFIAYLLCFKSFFIYLIKAYETKIDELINDNMNLSYKNSDLLEIICRKNNKIEQLNKKVHKEQVINMIRINGIDLWVEEKHMSDILTFEKFNKQISIDLGRITEVSDNLPHKQVNKVSVVCELAINQLYKSMN